MVVNLVEEKSKFLSLDRTTLELIYQHTWFLANFRFSRPIEVLQTRHTGYEKEDFVQEVVQHVCELFKTKKFPTVNHLKKMIRLTMSYHYLHEKRKYFYTKSRGSIQCTSLEEDINDYRKVEDAIIIDKSYENESIYDLHRLYSKNLYVVYNWKIAKVITKEQFKDFTDYTIISVNFFIDKQREAGIVNTCRYYKQHGYYMTKSTFNLISQTIIDYLKDNDILLIEEEPKPIYVRPRVRKSEEELHKASNTCLCGYIHNDNDFDNSSWQCPKCGRIHDKQELQRFNLGEIDNYNIQEHKPETRQFEQTKFDSIKVSLEETRLNLIKQYKKEFNNILEDEELSLDDMLDTSEELVLI